jgi:hypothetical protein
VQEMALDVSSLTLMKNEDLGKGKHTESPWRFLEIFNSLQRASLWRMEGSLEYRVKDGG